MSRTAQLSILHAAGGAVRTDLNPGRNRDTGVCASRRDWLFLSARHATAKRRHRHRREVAALRY